MNKKYQIIIMDDDIEILPNTEDNIEGVNFEVVKNLTWDEAKLLSIEEIRKKIQMLKIEYDIFKEIKCLRKIYFLNVNQFLILNSTEKEYSSYFEQEYNF